MIAIETKVLFSNQSGGVIYKMVVGGGLGVGNNNILLLRLRWKELCLQLSHQIRLLARSSLLLLSKYQFIC